MHSDPRRTWRTGYGLLLVAPFVGLPLTLTDPPRWLQILGVVVIVALVAVGSSKMRRPDGAWRPSQTLTHPHDDER